MPGERGQEKWPTCVCGSTKYHAPQAAWDKFLHPELMIKDSPQPHSLDVINSMRKQGWYVVFMTGRGERLRSVTEEWLRTHMDWTASEPLIMRPADANNVPASQMKEQMFLEFRAARKFENAPFLFFEDDRFVIGTWQKYGMVFLCPQAWETMNPVVFHPVVEPAWNR